MTLNLMMPQQNDLKPRITVFGVGGAGGNAVNNMIEKQLDGVEFVVANTDAQALAQSQATNKIQMGVKVTEGLGAGARPSVGAAAAEETIEEIVDHLSGAHMCFITAGMGGGTGTGAAPIIAQAARELGVLTVGVVTKPFQFEGAKRMGQAEKGVEALQQMVDTLIIIPNQNLFRIANEKTTFTEAFSMADDVLYQGVKGVTDLMVRPGLINLDFADVRSVMDEMGKAMMGTGEATGEDRAVQAAEKAIANPLLDEISLKGAKGVLINITGGYDLTLFELDEAANRIRDEVDAEANIIVGSTLDTEMDGTMRVSVVATGIDAVENTGEVPQPRRRLAEAAAPVAGLSEPEEQPQHAAAPAMPATEPAAAQAASAAAAPAPAPERNLFQGFESRRPATAASGAQADAETAEDLPPPAYQPREPQQEAASRDATPGAPSPEALDRLHRAVASAPEQSGFSTRNHGQKAEDAAAGVGNKPRFGLRPLIDRMTGHPGEPQPKAPGAALHERRQPAVSSQQSAPAPAEQEPDPEQERIEIPAFLRRQAN